MVNIVYAFSFMEEAYAPSIVLFSTAKIFRFHMQNEHCVIACVHIATAALCSQ